MPLKLGTRPAGDDQDPNKRTKTLPKTGCAAGNNNLSSKRIGKNFTVSIPTTTTDDSADAASHRPWINNQQLVGLFGLTGSTQARLAQIAALIAQPTLLTTEQLAAWNTLTPAQQAEIFAAQQAEQ